jgi:hypothetical protein
MDWQGAIRAIDWGALFPVFTLLVGILVTATIEERRSRASERRAQATTIDGRLYDQRMCRLADTRLMIAGTLRTAFTGKEPEAPPSYPNASVRLLGEPELVRQYAAVVLEAKVADQRDQGQWELRVMQLRDECLRALAQQEERVARGEEPLQAAVRRASATEVLEQTLGR